MKPVLEAIQRAQAAKEQSRILLSLPVYPWLPRARPSEDKNG